MRLLVASEADEASVTFRRAILCWPGWKEAGTFGGRPFYRRGDDLLVSLDTLHLNVDDLDLMVERELGLHPSTVVYLSKHESESARRTFTVHPIGNWHQAEFGGRPGQLVPAAPRDMTGALVALKRLAGQGSYGVSFEATHHGPFLTTPTFFIEVGSDLWAWEDEGNAAVIVEALEGPVDGGARVLVGVGGGHYAPRFSDLAAGRRVAMGHMIPGYALRRPVGPLIERAVSATPGASGVYIHRKATEKDLVREVEAWCADRGLPVVHEADLPPRGAPEG